MSNKNIIQTYNISKIYKLKGKSKEIKAIDNINFSVKEGEIFGLLGPNGAGKTTLINILTTLIQPTTGYAIIDGINILKEPKKCKSKVALMLDRKMLYYRITAYDNLKFFCKIYDIPDYKRKIYKIVREFGLEKWLNQYVSNFSTGMMIKLALCRTLLLNRKVLFLDEPTLGLDVATKSFIIEKLKKIDGTILLTSHDMEVVEQLCDRVAFINNGEIFKIGTKKDIKNFEQNKIRIEIEILEKKSQLKDQLNRQDFIIQIIDAQNGFIIEIRSREDYKDLLSILSKFKILKVKELDLTMGNLFINLIKKVNE